VALDGNLTLTVLPNLNCVALITTPPNCGTCVHSIVNTTIERCAGSIQEGGLVHQYNTLY